MKIGVCDDEERISEMLKKEIETYMQKNGLELEFYSFRSETDLKQFLSDHELDLLFMDIEMPGKNGIDLAGEIVQLQPDCQIAFCTNYLEFAVDVYETRHCYYVLKEEFAQRLPNIIRKVLREQQRGEGRICIETHGRKEIIRTKEIIYIERIKKKSCIHLVGGELRETAAKLDDLYALLGSSEFVRCHKSFIVSFEKVSRYSRQEMSMITGENIPISRPCIELVKRAFMEWSCGKM